MSGTTSFGSLAGIPGRDRRPLDGRFSCHPRPEFLALSNLTIRVFAKFIPPGTYGMLAVAAGSQGIVHSGSPEVRAPDRSAAMKTAVRPRTLPRTPQSQINGLAYYRHLLANRPHPLENLDALAVMMPHRRGEEICSQGLPVEYWYLVVTGAARRCAIRPDGRPQIVDLLPPGDFSGFAIGQS